MFIRFQLSLLDKYITTALKESAFYNSSKNTLSEQLDLKDVDRKERWVILAENYIEKVWKQKKYRQLFEYHEVDFNELVNSFLYMTLATMPNPLIKTGPGKLSNSLVATSMYQEVDTQLKSFLGYLRAEKGTIDREKSVSVDFARILKERHDKSFGDIKMDEIN